MTWIEKIFPDRGKEIFEFACQRNFGETAEQWLEKWDNGEYHLGHDHPDHMAIVKVYMLIPFVRKIDVSEKS